MVQDFFTENPQLVQTWESMFEEATLTRKHFTMQEALAVLVVERFNRHILRKDEALKLFEYILKTEFRA